MFSSPRLGSSRDMDIDAVEYVPSGVAPDPLMGKTFDLITVLAPAADSVKGSKRYFVRCRCGTEMLVYERRLIGTPRIKSCGCRGKDAKPKPWTEEQLEIIRREYPLKGGLCAPQVGRSPHQVRRKANELKVAFVGKLQRRGLWSEEEDNIIREHYPHGGTAACLPFLPERTKHATRDRAHQLRIGCPMEERHGIWTKPERALVRKYYPEGGWRAVKPHLPHRSANSIQNIATTMGVQVKKSWTKAEEREFKKLYLKGGAKACKERWPERTIVSIRGKARTMKLRYMKNWWTPEEDRIVREHFPTGGWRAVHALLPHRGEGAIHGYCTKHKIKICRWSPEEDAVLRAHYPDGGARACVKLLPHLTMNAVRNRVQTLGLRWNGSWTAEEVAVLKRLYPEGGLDAVAKALPHRNRESIRSKTYCLGLRLTKEAYAKSQQETELEPEPEQLAA